MRRCQDTHRVRRPTDREAGCRFSCRRCWRRPGEAQDHARWQRPGRMKARACRYRSRNLGCRAQSTMQTSIPPAGQTCRQVRLTYRAPRSNRQREVSMKSSGQYLRKNQKSYEKLKNFRQLPKRDITTVVSFKDLVPPKGTQASSLRPTSAANLKFLSVPLQVSYRNFKFEA